jgi:class 3 adenylate cyclase
VARWPMQTAEAVLTLAQLVNEIAAHHQGEVVKMLGDGVHFHFHDPGDAVRASLEIVENVRPRGLPPAHIGVNADR